MCLSRPCHSFPRAILPAALPFLLLLLPALLAAPTAYAQTRQHDTLLLHFAFNSYRIEPGPDSLRWQQLFNHPGKSIDTVFITGYTDTVGTAAYNQHLATLRAVTAGIYVRNRMPGAAPSFQLTGGGKAPTRQASDSANRRAELVFSYTTTAPMSAASATPPTATSAAPPTATSATPPAAASAPQSTTSPQSAPPPASAALRKGEQPIPDTTVARAPTAVISLQHINFIVDTPIPTEATRTVLPGYVQLLQQYKDRPMEIDGYVNSFVPLHGETDPLFILSLKRAKFIYDYLVDAGFDPARLTYKGMGNAKPINPDPATRDEMNANMRVEIKVY